MDTRDLILIAASGLAGAIIHYLLEVWADRRAKPYYDGWKRSHEFATNCQLREAYRAGQEQAKIQQLQPIEAPAPTLWQ